MIRIMGGYRTSSEVMSVLVGIAPINLLSQNKADIEERRDITKETILDK